MFSINFLIRPLLSKNHRDESKILININKRRPYEAGKSLCSGTVAVISLFVTLSHHSHNTHHIK